jgi:hypothetical protein
MTPKLETIKEKILKKKIKYVKVTLKIKDLKTFNCVILNKWSLCLIYKDLLHFLEKTNSSKENGPPF